MKYIVFVFIALFLLFACVADTVAPSSMGSAGSVAAPPSVDVISEAVTNGTYATVSAAWMPGYQQPGDFHIRNDVNTIRLLSAMYWVPEGLNWLCTTNPDSLGGLCSSLYYPNVPLWTNGCVNVNQNGYTRKCNWGLSYAQIGYVWTKATGNSWTGLASFSGTGQFGTMTGSNHTIVVSGP